MADQFSALGRSNIKNRMAIPKLPDLPKDVVDRFPSLKQWMKDLEDWRQQTSIVIRGSAD